LKATRKGFLKGCPNISKELICKYLNPSPATTKGHMKPHAMVSKARHQKQIMPEQPYLIQSPEVIHPTVRRAKGNTNPGICEPPHRPGPTLIANNYDKSIADVFFFGEFADKNTGIVYQDMTGNFPFMSLDGCYFIMYHYKSNSILATAIDGLEDKTIFAAYKQRFN
jgi:hypothetical protein